jgi:hypothetical protein
MYAALPYKIIFKMLKYSLFVAVVYVFFKDMAFRIRRLDIEKEFVYLIAGSIINHFCPGLGS